MSTDPEQLYGKPWNEGEYVIVLEGYLSHRDDVPSGDLSWVQELSGALGRTEAAVVLRVLNFIALDPEQPPNRRGLDHGGPICGRIFDKWHQVPRDELSRVAWVVRETVRPDPQMSLFAPARVRMPRAFGKYELMDKLGEGRFANVFSCVDAAGHKVALKILKMESVTCQEVLGRFRREIAALKTVDHHNVLELYEDNLREECDYPALAMAQASCSLREYLDQSGTQAQQPCWPVLPPAEAAHIVRAVAAGALALHEHRSRIIHRDITPNNVLRMPDGTWVLADFGLCKFLGPVTTSVSFSTVTGQGWGTEPYAAPEQWRSFTNADERTDVYALGVLVWELFTAEGPPFDPNSLGLPAAIETFLHESRTRDRSERIQSVGEFIDRFNGACATSGLST